MPAATSRDIQLAETVRTYNLTLPLIFQGAYLGDVPVAAAVDGHISVNVDRFIGLLGERLSPEMTAALKLLAGGQQVVAIEAFVPAGVTVAYDTAKLELRVSIPVDKQGGQSLSAVEDNDRGRPSLAAIAPESYSASLTLTARQAYVWSPDAARGWDPFRVSADFAGNLFGHEGLYLFAQGEYDEAASDPLHRGNVVLMYDDIANALRYSAGDVTPVPAGFQSSPILGGVSLQRQYGELQPFRNVRPSGLFRFSLDRASTVDVVVNGDVHERELVHIAGVDVDGPLDLTDLDSVRDCARRFLDLGVRGAGAGQADIGANGVVEERGFLRHQRDRLPHRSDLYVADILAVYAHVASGRVVEPRQQVKDRGLARAGRANERHRLAWRNTEAHIV